MPIEARQFLEPARDRGFHFWAGVPCSYLKPFINYIIDAEGLTYVSAANEGDAVAAATGAALAGKKSVVLMQNSGLGNAVSPLSSLNWVFRIPVLLIITLRGDPAIGDEPQHELMGQVTTRLLEDLDIEWRWFPDTADTLDSALADASGHMDHTGRPFAFVMRKGSVRAYDLRSGPKPPASGAAAGPDNDATYCPSRHEVLLRLVDATHVDDSVIIGSTGYTGRELYAIADRPNHLYVVGSMGCASALGLGLSLSRPDLRVVIADGDGAALMRMGNLATIGAYGGPRLFHLLLDNGVHESTGGQATVSRSVRFAEVAGACGYRSAETCSEPGDIDDFLRRGSGPAFLHVRTARGTPEGLPRPAFTPASVKQRLMRHLGVATPWSGAGV